MKSGRAKKSHHRAQSKMLKSTNLEIKDFISFKFSEKIHKI